MTVADYMVAYGEDIKQAMNKASVQFKNQPVFPERMEIAEEFAGVDPLGKSSRTEMAFAERMQTLQARAATHHAPNEGLGDILHQPMPEEIAQAGMEQRLFQRAVRIVADGMDPKDEPEKMEAKLLSYSERQMSENPAVKDYDMQLTALEYALSVKEGPVPQEVKDYMKETYHKDMDKMVPAPRTKWTGQISLPFDTPDNADQMQYFTDKKNWDKTRDDCGSGYLPDEKTFYKHNEYVHLSAFCTASAKRILDDEFQEFETKHGVNRENLIVINGEPVRDLIKDIPFATPQEKEAAISNIVGVAVQAGNKVECFRPDPVTGFIAEEPTPIAAEGYQASKVDKPHMNRWEQFWSRHGFYKDKAEQLERYNEYQIHLADVKKDVMQRNDHALEEKSLTEVRKERSEAAWALTKGREILDKRMKDPLVQQALEKCKPYVDCCEDGLAFNAIQNDQYYGLNSRGTTLSSKYICNNRMSGMIGDAVMLKNGYSYEDIVDPTKLQAEKKQAVQQIREMVGRNDPKEAADLWAATMPVLLDQPVPEGFNHASPQETMKHRGFTYALNLAQGISQESSMPDVRKEMGAAYARISYNKERIANNEAPVTDWKAWETQPKSPEEQAQWEQRVKQGAADYDYDHSRVMCYCAGLDAHTKSGNFRTYVDKLTLDPKANVESVLHSVAVDLVAMRSAELGYEPALKDWGAKDFKAIPSSRDGNAMYNRPWAVYHKGQEIATKQLTAKGNGGPWDKMILESKDVADAVKINVKRDMENGMKTDFKIEARDDIIKAVTQAKTKAAPAKGK